MTESVTISEEGALRPTTLESFVGQESILEQIQVSLISALRRKAPFPHLLLAGPPGLGKTTLAEIVARERGVPFISAMASSISSDEELDAIFGKLPIDGYDVRTGKVVDEDSVIQAVVFVDEVHRLKRSVTETLHTALEDFRVTLKKKNPVTGQNNAELYWLPRFTFIGATNYLGTLPRPFVDRFPLQFIFETYSDEDLSSVISFSSKQLGFNIDSDSIAVIANKSRGTPRIANRFLLLCRDVAIAMLDGSVEFDNSITIQHVEEMLRIQEIDDLGLSRLDRRVLQYLATMKRPVGLKSVAQGVDEDVKTIEFFVEPWLVKQKLIAKTSRGRIVTTLGQRHIGDQVEDLDTFGLRRLVQS